MATTVDTLLVRIEADLKDVNRKLKQFDRRVDDTQKGAAKGFNKIANVAKLALGAVVIQQFAKAGMAAVKFASGVEEMQAKSSVVFGQFAGEVRSSLEAFGNEVGRSTFELEGMASSIQDTFVPMGFARGEAAKLSVNLTKLAVDVASFNNASDTQTMAAFQSALVGNHETVRRFGIVITEATLQQELYRMGVTENAADVDNATKVQARMNLILAGTTDAHGDAARTADSFANRSKALQAQLDELLVSVLTPLLPALADTVKGLTDGAKALTEFLEAVGIIEEAQTASVIMEQMASNVELLAEKELELVAAQARLNEEMNNKDFASAMQRFFVDGKFAGAEALRIRIAGINEEMAELAQRNEDLATQMVADSFGVASIIAPDASKDDAPTKGQQKAAQKITDALKDQRNALELLKLEAANVTDAYIATTAAAQGLEGISREQFETLLNLNTEEAELKQTLEDQAQAAKDAATAQALRDGELKKVKDTISALTSESKLLDLENENLSASELEYQTIMMQLGENVAPEYKEKLRELIEAKQKSIQVTDAQKKAEDKFNNSVSKGTSFVESLKTEEERLNETMANLGDAYAANQINQEQFNAGVESVNKSMMELDPTFIQVQKGVEKVADGISNALAEAFVSGKLSMSSLGDVFKQIIKQMIADAIKAQIIKFLMGSIFGAAGGGSVSSFGGSGNASQANSTLSHAGGGAISRYGRAGGGMAMPTLVGERGPELFVPHTAGVVRNNHDTKNMMGGGSPVVVNQNINIETGVAQTVRAEVMSMMPRIKSETIQAMIDGKRRGNSISKAFA